MLRASFAFVLLLSSCQPDFSSNSEVTDIVGPGKSRSLVRNIPLSKSFEDTLISFGYQKGSSCLQEIKEVSRDGSEKFSFKLFGKPCAKFPISGPPIAHFDLLKWDFIEQKTWVVSQGTIVGEINRNSEVSLLCFKNYAKNCDLSLSFEDGSIESITPKSEGLPAIGHIPENSPLAKSVLFIANKASEKHLKLMGLTEKELDVLWDHRLTIGDFLSIRGFAGYSSSLGKVPGKIAVFSKLVNLDETAKLVSNEKWQFRPRFSCNRKMMLLVRFLDSDWKWQTGKWEYDPEEDMNSFYLNYSGKRLKHIGKYFYYYAETLTGSKSKVTGEDNYSYRGANYPFKIKSATNKPFEIKCR